MPPRTQRRKLHKKIKHKPYRKCVKCREPRCKLVLRDIANGGYQLLKVCGKCGLVAELKIGRVVERQTHTLNVKTSPGTAE